MQDVLEKALGQQLSSPVNLKELLELQAKGRDAVLTSYATKYAVLSYLVPELHRLSALPGRQLSWGCLVVVPTRQRVQQVLIEASPVYAACSAKCTAVLGEGKKLRDAVLQAAQLIVTTPGCLREVLQSGMVRAELWRQHAGRPGLGTLVVDSADTLLAMPGYEDDLRAVAPFIPATTRRVLSFSSASPAPNSWLFQALMQDRNPVTVHAGTDQLTAGPNATAEAALTSLQEPSLADDAQTAPQTFAWPCERQDRLLVAMALLKLAALRKKALLFAAAASFAARLRLLLGAFGLRAAVLHASLPRNSRHRIIQEFNAAVLDFLIVADDALAHLSGGSTEGPSEDQDSEDVAEAEAGAVPGGDGDEATGHRKRKRRDAKIRRSSRTDLRGVKSVVHVDPPSHADFTRRSQCLTASSTPSRVEVVLVLPSSSDSASPEGAEGNAWADALPKFTAVSQDAIERLRYRAEDVARSLTPAVVREARAKELQAELLASETLQEHFKAHPGDLTVLKGSKPRHRHALEPAMHLKHMPGYLRANAHKPRHRSSQPGGGGPAKATFTNPFKSSKKRKGNKIEDSELTEMEKAAIAAAPKRSKHQQSTFKPKHNVRKGKIRKR